MESMESTGPRSSLPPFLQEKIMWDPMWWQGGEGVGRAEGAKLPNQGKIL